MHAFPQTEKRPQIFQSGFSLVELSIVLVILGLLIGGVLTGQNLIQAAELRSASKEYTNWQTAVNLFREKYMAIPGDMINATSFWGTASGACATPGTATGTAPQTCNGNGDGNISDYSTAARMYESVRFWQHLANAGLIEGSYSGVQGPLNEWSMVAGTNVPRSKYRNGTWAVTYRVSTWTGDGTYFNGNYGNYYQLGTSTGGWPNGGFLPEEIWNLDMKMDDGKPGTGKVITMWWGCTSATSKDDWAAAQYVFPSPCTPAERAVPIFTENKFH